VIPCQHHNRGVRGGGVPQTWFVALLFPRDIRAEDGEVEQGLGGRILLERGGQGPQELLGSVAVLLVEYQDALSPRCAFLRALDGASLAG